MAKVKFQFHTDLEGPKEKLYLATAKELEKLSKRYDAILSADVTLDSGVKDKNPYNLKATVILKTKIKNYVATKIEKSPLQALGEAFDAAEKQLRKSLDKINRPWEKPKNV